MAGLGVSGARQWLPRDPWPQIPKDQEGGWAGGLDTDPVCPVQLGRSRRQEGLAGSLGSEGWESGGLGIHCCSAAAQLCGCLGHLCFAWSILSPWDSRSQGDLRPLAGSAHPTPTPILVAVRMATCQALCTWSPWPPGALLTAQPPPLSSSVAHHRTHPGLAMAHTGGDKPLCLRLSGDLVHVQFLGEVWREVGTEPRPGGGCPGSVLNCVHHGGLAPHHPPGWGVARRKPDLLLGWHCCPRRGSRRVPSCPWVLRAEGIPAGLSWVWFEI